MAPYWGENPEDLTAPYHLSLLLDNDWQFSRCKCGNLNSYWQTTNHKNNVFEHQCWRKKWKWKGPGHTIGMIGEWGKNAKRYSIPYGWSMCNRELFLISSAVMIQGGRKTWNLNLRLSFLFLVYCARYIVKAIDFSLRKTFLAVSIRHSFPALTLKHSEDLEDKGWGKYIIGLQGKELQCCVLWEKGQSTPGGYST